MSIYEFDEDREMAIIRADERELGREEGREAGKAEGRTEGERRITVLHKYLLNDGRIEDLRKAVVDDAYQNALCREYGI